MRPVAQAVPVQLGTAGLTDEPTAVGHEHAVRADEPQQTGHRRAFFELHMPSAMGGSCPAGDVPASVDARVLRRDSCGTRCGLPRRAAAAAVW